jgi:iron complex outermembrane receptor protein
MSYHDKDNGVAGARIGAQSGATLACLLIGSMASSASMAQATGEATSAVKTTLEEIIVTAERRSEDIQKTAASVSVRLGDDLVTQGKYQLAQILEDVPGITGGAKENSGNADIPGSDNVAAGLIIRGIPSNAPAGGNITTTAWRRRNTSMMSTTHRRQLRH